LSTDEDGDDDDDDDKDTSDDKDDKADQSGVDDEDGEDAPASAEDAPPGWSDPMKELFSSLPEEARDYISGREKAAHAQLSEQGRVIATLKPVNDVVEGYRHTFQSRGLSPDQAISGLFEAQDLLDRDPVAGIQQIAQIYGVDLSGAAPNLPQDGGNADTAALRVELMGLKQNLSAMNAAAETDRNTRAAEANKTTMRQVTEWSEGKPHFEEVRHQMAGLINAGAAQDLDDAYDKACLLSPEIQKKILASNKVDKKAQDEMDGKMETVRAAKAAKQAKRRSRVGPGKQVDVVKKAGSWEDTMDEVAGSIFSG
jgi:hypothetical protein